MINVINLWRYWRMGARDLVLIDLQFCSLSGSLRFIIFNIGFSINFLDNKIRRTIKK